MNQITPTYLIDIRQRAVHLPKALVLKCPSRLESNAMYIRTCPKQYCWDRGVSIELDRLLN